MKPIKIRLSKTELSRLSKLIAVSTLYRQAAASKPLFIITPCLGVHAGLPYFCLHCCSREFEGFYDLEGMKKRAKELFISCRKTVQPIDDIYHNIYLLFKKIKSSFNHAGKLNFDSISLELLGKIILELDELNFQMWAGECFLVDDFDPEGDKLLQEELVKEKIRLTAEEVSILIQPLYLNFIEESNRELQNIARRGLRAYNQLLKELEPFAKKYFYVQNSWNVAKVLEAKDFLIPLKELINSNDTQHFLYYDNLIANRREEIASLDKKYHFSSSLKNIFHLFRVLNQIRDERKEIVLLMNHFNELAAKRIANDFNINKELLYQALPKELASICNTNNASLVRTSIENRKGSLLVGKVKKDNPFLLTGEEAEEIISIIHHKMFAKDEQIKGQVACKGKSLKIRGIVKIINGESHFTKFLPGEILVTAMTRPEFVPLMRQAKAVITDEGGITCHAAVISRELNVPCLIGTKIATKKLDDGREVEIDLEKGIVKKV